MPHLLPFLAENSLFKAIGQIFHPVFELFASILAGIYSVVPNYAVAITVLTILIMAALTPLTVKSTRSMIAMQRLAPELKKIQQKYKGDRETLNTEMMRLYKENNVSPAGGCLPMFLQFPFLIVLYDILRGLTNTVAHGKRLGSGAICHMTPVCADPRYIPKNSRMYTDLVAHPGQMYAFHVNLALKPFSHHSSFWAAIPFFVLVLLAVGLQYVQMTQMNRRNPAAAQANPQMQTMQKLMPIVMAYIYFLIPAAVVIYMVVSTAIRILTQDIMFRTGMVQSPGATTVIAPSSSAGGATKKAGPTERVIPASGKPSNGTGAKKAPASTNGAGAKNGRQSAAKNGQSESEAAVPPETKAHPRSRDKRARRAR